MFHSPSDPYALVNCSSIYDERTDLSRERVEDEDEKNQQDCQDEQSDDVLLVFFPNEEDEGLHGVDKPVEGCLGATNIRQNEERDKMNKKVSNVSQFHGFV